MQFIISLLLLVFMCYAEKSLKIDIYPGFGWDHLRFLDMSPIFDVSNFNNSDILQSCIEIIPLHENKIETGSIVIDAFDSRTNDYSSKHMIGGSADFSVFKIGGSYSNEYQTLKQQQGIERTITLRNHIDYLMYDVILQSSCPLNTQVKKDLIDIAKYRATDQVSMATYTAQMFIKKYGTHFTSRLQLGGSINEDDYVSHAAYNSSDTTKRLHKTAAEASFLNTLSLSANFNSDSGYDNNSINQYKQNIRRKVITSKGGDVFITGNHMETWQSSVKTQPAIIRRAIENMTYFIQSDQIPELTEVALMNVREEIDKAINTYVQMNAIRGCMKRDSALFNWIANINDDNSCTTGEQNSQFGGFIRTCTEDSGMNDKCKEYQLKNFYTGMDECVPGFTKYLLHQSIQNEAVYRRECHGCGFLWLSNCCDDIYIGSGQRNLSLYACNKNNQSSSSYTTSNTNSMYIYGGSYTSKKANPVTEQFSCPNGFSKQLAFDDVTVCLAESLSMGMMTLSQYGGMFSCNYGNIAGNTSIKECPVGYSVYVIGAIDGTCLLNVCLKFQNFETTQIPAVVVPPFVDIKMMNSSTEINQTMQTGIITSRMMGKSEVPPQTIPVTSSQSNNIGLILASVALALVIGCIAIIGLVQMKKYQKRRNKRYNDSNHMNMAFVKA